MENVTQYDYRVSWVDDDTEAVNATMREWADLGWELVSGSTSCWVRDELVSGRSTPREDVWHTRFVMYWRKPMSA